MKCLFVRSFALIALLIAPAGAMTVGGVDLPTSKEGKELSGAGLLRKGYFFKIYVGALYLEKNEASQTDLLETPKRIDIHYFHKTPKKHMLRVAEKTLQKNLSESEYNALKPRIDKLHEAFLDGMKGSYASIEHTPGEGLVYSFNEETVITIPGDDFANAYFTIWLGERPSSRTMKEAMLNKG